jgi:hypothetical protein
MFVGVGDYIRRKLQLNTSRLEVETRRTRDFAAMRQVVIEVVMQPDR